MFFFNYTATTEIYTLSLHDALPISCGIPARGHLPVSERSLLRSLTFSKKNRSQPQRSEEHTSELQSRQYLVCRLLLEKKKYHRAIRHRCASKRSPSTSAHGLTIGWR